MLRRGHERWWQRLVWRLRVPSYVLVRPAELRRCPECAAPYEPTDRYCPSCHVRVPEWRF